MSRTFLHFLLTVLLNPGAPGATLWKLKYRLSLCLPFNALNPFTAGRSVPSLGTQSAPAESRGFFGHVLNTPDLSLRGAGQVRLFAQ